MADIQPPEGLVDLMLAARDKHVFVNVTTCACGFQPPMSSDWERHRMAVALAAVVPLIRAQTLREYADRWHYVDHTRWPMSTFGAAPTPYCACGKTWPEGGCTERRNLIADAGLDADDRRDEFNGQIARGLRQLDGSTASAVALLTGMSRDEIDQLGGVTPADEPAADVVAAFEGGEKGVTKRPVSATAIRGALYDSLSPNFEIDSDGYDDAAVAVALLVEGQERSEEQR